jgi:hypothetical protein
MEPKNINMYCQIMNVIIIIYQIFNMNVKGVDKLHSFWAYKALRIGIGHKTFGGLNFEFLLSLVLLFILMVTWGLSKSGSFWKLRTFVDTHFWNKGKI